KFTNAPTSRQNPRHPRRRYRGFFTHLASLFCAARAVPFHAPGVARVPAHRTARPRGWSGGPNATDRSAIVSLFFCAEWSTESAALRVLRQLCAGYLLSL